MIGHLKPFNEDPTTDIWSRAYDSNGNTLDYVYEVDDQTLTIWAGGKDSPAFYRGEFLPTAVPTPAPGPIPAAATDPA